MMFMCLRVILTSFDDKFESLPQRDFLNSVIRSKGYQHFVGWGLKIVKREFCSTHSTRWNNSKGHKYVFKCIMIYLLKYLCMLWVWCVFVRLIHGFDMHLQMSSKWLKYVVWYIVIMIYLVLYILYIVYLV